jgi:hypothetical protein
MAQGLLWTSLGLCCLMSETTVDDKYEYIQKTIKIRDEVQVYPNKPLRDALITRYLLMVTRCFCNGI